jgi:hypothetical protein
MEPNMTTEGAPKSLIEFATTDRRDVTWLAQQDVWPEVVAGYRDGVKVTTIRLWLVRERGFHDKQLPSPETLARYLRNNYPRDDQ